MVSSNLPPIELANQADLSQCDKAPRLLILINGHVDHEELVAHAWLLPGQQASSPPTSAKMADSLTCPDDIHTTYPSSLPAKNKCLFKGPSVRCHVNVRAREVLWQCTALRLGLAEPSSALHFTPTRQQHFLHGQRKDDTLM